SEDLLHPVRIHSLTCDEMPKRAQDFDVEEMRHEKGFAAIHQFASHGIRQRAVRKKLDDDRCIQNDHRSSRNSRMIWAALRFEGIGFACRVRANHSAIVGRSALFANSRLMKSERVIPSRAARDLRMP